MNVGLSEQARNTAEANYVYRAKQNGLSEFSIRVLDLQHELRRAGFPPNHVRQICEALRSNLFLKRNGLRLLRTEGPPSLTSTTVVFHYAFEDVEMGSRQPAISPAVGRGERAVGNETANRPESDPLLDLRGVLKGAIREGADAFLRELRRDRA